MNGFYSVADAYLNQTYGETPAAPATLTPAYYLAAGHRPIGSNRWEWVAYYQSLPLYNLLADFGTQNRLIARYDFTSDIPDSKRDQQFHRDRRDEILIELHTRLEDQWHKTGEAAA